MSVASQQRKHAPQFHDYIISCSVETMHTKGITQGNKCSTHTYKSKHTLEATAALLAFHISHTGSVVQKPRDSPGWCVGVGSSARAAYASWAVVIAQSYLTANYYWNAGRGMLGHKLRQPDKVWLDIRGHMQEIITEFTCHTWKRQPPPLELGASLPMIYFC